MSNQEASRKRQLALAGDGPDISVSEMEVLHDLIHRRIDELGELAKLGPDEAAHQEYHTLESLHDKLFQA